MWQLKINIISLRIDSLGLRCTGHFRFSNLQLGTVRLHSMISSLSGTNYTILSAAIFSCTRRKWYQSNGESIRVDGSMVTQSFNVISNLGFYMTRRVINLIIPGSLTWRKRNVIFAHKFHICADSLDLLLKDFCVLKLLWFAINNIQSLTVILLYSGGFFAFLNRVPHNLRRERGRVRERESILVRHACAPLALSRPTAILKSGHLSRF